MQQVPQHFQPEDDINLFEIAANLWKGKYWILFATTLSVLASVGYLLLATHPSRSSIEIKPLLEDELSQFDRINREYALGTRSDGIIDKKFGLIGKDGEAIVQIETVQKEESDLLEGPNLLTLFMDELRLRQTLSQAILETKYIEKKVSESEAELMRRVARTANGFKFTPALTDEQYWKLEIDTSSSDEAGKPDIARKMIAKAFEYTNEKVRLSILGSIASWKQGVEISHQYGMEDIATSRSNAIEDYDRKMASNLAFLQEQVKIAKALNYRDNQFLLSGAPDNLGNTLVNNILSNNSKNVANSSAESLYFLRGYLEIEQEIGLLTNRKNKEHFIPALATLDQQSRFLKQDDSIKHADEALAMANLSAEKFHSVNYDLGSMNFVPKVRKSVVLIIAGVFGLLVGSIGYLFWLGMRNFARNEDNQS